jgi:hypothetical protein
MKLLMVFVFVSAVLVGCKKKDVEPVSYPILLVKTITYFGDGNSIPYMRSNHYYDNQDKISEKISEVAGGSPSRVHSYEYIGEHQVNLTSGDRITEFHFNSEGDPIKMNEDIFSYVYEGDEIRVNVTSDSDTWEEIYTVKGGNTVQFVNLSPGDASWEAEYDNKPNYQSSTCFSNGHTRGRKDKNNVISVSHTGDRVAVENYIYTYNEQGYVNSLVHTYQEGDYLYTNEAKIEYY